MSTAINPDNGVAALAYIPGAFRMDAQELEEKDDRLPRDREVILYCT